MFKNTLLTIITVAIVITVLIAGEIIFNVARDCVKSSKKTEILLDNTDDNRWQKDDTLHHKHVPGGSFRSVAEDGKEFDLQIYYNSKGLNDYEYAYEKGENTVRILVFGDSFVEAAQVKRNENFCKVLEKLLNDSNSATKYEVINMGVSAYSPMLEYLYLKEEGLQYNPDIVVACLFMNDIHDDMSYKESTLFDDSNLPLQTFWKDPDRTKKLKGWKRFERELCTSFKGLLHKSKVYVYLKKKVYQLLDFLKIKELKPESEAMFILYDKVSSKEESAWNDTLRYIKGMKDLSMNNNTKFLLVTIPLQDQILDNAKLSSNRFYFVEEIDSERPENIIRDFCSKNNINYISLYEEFTKNKEGNPYFRNNGHFNQIGHKRVANIVFDKLEELKFVE